MKEQCDNICNTCPINGQIYCALMFLKTNNENMKNFSERLINLENMLLEASKKNSSFDSSDLPVLDPNIETKKK